MATKKLLNKIITRDSKISKTINLSHAIKGLMIHILSKYLPRLILVGKKLNKLFKRLACSLKIKLISKSNNYY